MALEENISTETQEKKRDLENGVSEAVNSKEEKKIPYKLKDFHGIVDPTGRVLNPLAHFITRYTAATLGTVKGFYASPGVATLIGAQAIPGGVIATGLVLGYFGLSIGYTIGDLSYRAIRNIVQGIFHPIIGLKTLGKNMIHPAESLKKIYYTSARSFEEPGEIVIGLTENIVVNPIKTIYKSITNSLRLLWKPTSYQPA